MAERRMFAKTIIDSDAFLELPFNSQLLYFHLAMRADDEGFVNKVKTIMRMIGLSDDDIIPLFDKKFLIPFSSGVVVIKHWKIHNYVRKDTFTETKYKDERSLLEYDENKAWRLVDNEPLQSRGRAVDEPSTQVSIGKVSTGKVRIGKVRREKVETLALELALPHSLIPKLIDWIAHKDERGGEMPDTAIKGLIKVIKKNIDQYGEEAVSQLIDSMITEDRASIYFDRLERREPNGEHHEHGSGNREQEQHGIYLR